MNDALVTILEQAKQFLQQQAPADLLRDAIPFGIICLVVGIGFSVLGAKLGRFGVTSLFVLLGAWIGVQFSELTSFARPVCGLIGAAMLGVVGYQSFRLWVGVTAGLVLATVMAGVLGYQRVVPHVQEFERSRVWVGTESPGEYAVPTPSQQEAYLARGPDEWASELWQFVTSKDSKLEQNGKAVVLGALLTGLCFGVMALRSALILSTSLIGTALVTTAISTLAYRVVPGSYEAVQKNPQYAGILVGAFLVMSVVVQTLLTRSAPADKPAKASAKS